LTQEEQEHVEETATKYTQKNTGKWAEQAWADWEEATDKT
jgi:hypothetical protein